LQNNIIKDEEVGDETPPGSRKSTIRITKKDSRSPKKVRDDLIVLNNEEFKVQKEIV
jgi:hypothetical protein